MRTFAKVIGVVILLLITWCLFCLAVELTGIVLP
jgi:hypothetical protein